MASFQVEALARLEAGGFEPIVARAAAHQANARRVASLLAFAPGLRRVQ